MSLATDARSSRSQITLRRRIIEIGEIVSGTEDRRHAGVTSWTVSRSRSTSWSSVGGHICQEATGKET